MISFLLFAGTFDASYSVSLRDELRIRAATPYDAPDHAFAVDVELQPNLQLVLDWKTFRPVITYMPRFVFRQIEGEVRPALLHAGNITLPWRITETVSLQLREDASYGVADYSSLSNLLQTSGRLDSVVVGAQVATANSRTTLSTQARMAPRHTLDAGVFHSYITGIGDPTLISTPPQNSFGGFTQYNWQFARQWRIGATGDVSYTKFLPGPTIDVLQAAGRIGYFFHPQSELSAAAGYAFVFLDHWRPLPYARLAVTSNVNAPGGRWQVNASAQVLPFVDRFALAVYERLEVATTIQYRPTARISIRLMAQWTLALLDAVYGGQQLWILDSAIVWRIQPHVAVDFGARALSLKLSQGQIDQGNIQQPLQWLTFLGLTFDVRDHI